jgi:predicted ester cyclase
MFTEQQLRGNVQSVVEALNTRDWSALDKVMDEAFTADYVWHLDGILDPDRSPADAEQILRGFMEMTPGGWWTLDDVVVAGDKAATRLTAHRSDPETGKSQRMTELMFHHLKDGKFAEDWDVVSPWIDEE